MEKVISEVKKKQGEIGRRNLVSCNPEKGKPYLTSENARELQLKGVEVRKKNKERQRTMQEIAKWIMAMPVNKNGLVDKDAIVDLAETKDIHLTGGEAMILAQVRKAMEGDTSAFVAIRDTAGEKPKEQIEVGGLTMEEYANSHKVKF